MNITDKRIDNGKPFDWGRTSENYAKYRDIYPAIFYKKIAGIGLCLKGQTVLDLGTGTGVLPRNMLSYGAEWIGTDISEEQIAMAKLLSEGTNIKYFCADAKDISFPPDTFDVVAACRCFWYFDHEKLMPKLFKILKNDGKILVLYMAWLPFEDEVAGESEKLILKYSPDWSGKGETMKPIEIPKIYGERFELSFSEEYKLPVHFTRESWNGRVKACRAIGASLSKAEIDAFEKEHLDMLTKRFPEKFDVLHYAATAVLRKKDILDSKERSAQLSSGAKEK